MKTLRMDLSLLFLTLTVGAAISAYIENRKNSTQQENIERTGILNTELSKQIVSLSLCN